MGVFDFMRGKRATQNAPSIGNHEEFDFISKAYTETTSRPSIMQPYMATDTGAKLPIFPFPLIMINELADNIDALRIPIEALNREIFKNGFEIKEKFKWKCNDCQKEFQYKPIADEESEGLNEGLGKQTDKLSDKPNAFGNRKQKDSQYEQSSPDKQLSPNEIQSNTQAICDECGSTDITRPDPQNRVKVNNLIDEYVNGNRQTLKEISRQLERDLEVSDGCYLLVLKNYWLNSNGEIDPELSEIKELLRSDPPQVAVIADSDGRIGFDDKRNAVYVCPRFEHRDKRVFKPKCDRCGAQTLRATHEVSSVYSIGTPQPKRVIYADGEVIWIPGKYKPGLLYGFSPIYAVWSKAMALSHMDEYIRKYFDKMRPPRGMLIVASRNYETFRKMWSAYEKSAIEDPYMIHPMLVESENGGKNMAQWIDFTGSLKELEFIAVRKELREIIGAIYGVEPLYFNAASEGSTNQSLQVTVTNRAIKWSQDILKDQIFTPLLKMMGIDDWILQLKDGDDADRLRRLTVDAQEIQNHAQLQSMGFQIGRTHQGEWKCSKDPSNAMLMMGMIGGQGRGDSATGEKGRVGNEQGSPMKQRPSDEGGQSQGSPTPGGKKGEKFSVSNKGHTLEFWIKKFEENGFSTDEVVEIVKNWYSEEKKSGKVYYPTEENKTPETKKSVTYNVKRKDDGTIRVEKIETEDIPDKKTKFNIKNNNKDESTIEDVNEDE